VLLGVVFVVMLTIDLLPGDAVTLMLGEHATRDAVANLRAHLGLDKPFLVRYLDYVGQLLRGDLGRSFQQNRPVAAELSDAWPATLELTIAALLIAAVVGIVAGIASAVWPNSLFDGVARLFSLFGLQSGQLMGGAVLTETVFAWPGLGRLMVKAIFARDYVLLQGAVLVFALAFVVINLIVDLSYGLLDPRISRQG